MPETPDPALGHHVVGIAPVDADKQQAWIEAHRSVGPLPTVPGLMSLRLFRSVMQGRRVLLSLRQVLVRFGVFLCLLAVLKLLVVQPLHAGVHVGESVAQVTEPG